ncbi:class I SAM-dependent methyltransferase [Sphingomonas sp. AOB5]|uniref:class I SAM-dependent methyltransferase n=1 Tax=Sphingomonas sp. AOB5 TaxID=3034017 RepID=UPI0023F6AD99|nr:class I SAM-dependent methyltransferase [Sphingomonas sp. AOB5]MDF7775548.1 class I SAM-dependent methyltransferase [Sphingomonas sp. AOB5]
MAVSEKTEGRAASYTGPRDYRTQGRHAVFPETNHDECERFNYLAHVNRYIRGNIQPRIEDAYEARVEPKFEREHGRKPANRSEVRKALASEPMFQYYSGLRRLNMEQRQQAGRWVALRQAEELAAKAAALTDGDPRLQLNPELKIPHYLTDVHHHCMPGSYYEENFPGDVTNAANYDCGFFVTLGGADEPWLDGMGGSIARAIKQRFPDLNPRRIVDLGSTLGHNALSIARAFPDAEVIAIDVGAPMLRYGLARAKSLGVENIKFVQADATDLSMFEDGSVDLITSLTLLHEVSFPALRKIFAETHRLLRKGGVVAHADVTGNTSAVSLCTQAVRDWDSYFNNEPFWKSLRDLDQHDYLKEAGFAEESFFYAAPIFDRYWGDEDRTRVLDGRFPPESSTDFGVQLAGAQK